MMKENNTPITKEKGTGSRLDTGLKNMFYSI